MRRQLLISVALGLVTTVIVAWSIAASTAYGRGACRIDRGDRYRDPAAGEGDGELRATRFRRPGLVLIETTASRAYVVRGEPTPETLIPRWARRAALPWGSGQVAWPGPDAGDRRVVRATGWPFKALWHEYTWRRDPAMKPNLGEFLSPGGVRIEPSNGTPGAWPVDYPRALPLLPAWGGLAADAALYGAGWLLALSVVGGVRRSCRRVRGRCPACGYALAGLPIGSACPECGNTLRRHRA